MVGEGGILGATGQAHGLGQSNPLNRNHHTDEKD